MIATKLGVTTITCDKCGISHSASSDKYNDQFFESGWGLFPNAKKYVHRCWNCLSPKEKRAIKWGQRNFPPKTNQHNED